MALSFDYKKIIRRILKIKEDLTSLLVKKSDVSRKIEVNFKAIRNLGIGFFFIFIAVVMLMPDQQTIEFSEKIDSRGEKEMPTEDHPSNTSGRSGTAQVLWGSSGTSRLDTSSGGHETQVNHNTSMVLGPKGGNAKVQIRAGVRLPLRIVDKFIVSVDPVPILAELLMDAVTDSGLRLAAGTRFYGEASFETGAERAKVQFRQISLLNGQIRPFAGIAVGKDGQPGIAGRVYSDGLKNTAGSLLTTFVGGLAEGSVETDFMGRSRGGLGNGLLTAVASTAKERAQAYGEKMKAEREWIEVSAGSECDALLNESVNLQPGMDE